MLNHRLSMLAVLLAVPSATGALIRPVLAHSPSAVRPISRFSDDTGYMHIPVSEPEQTWPQPSVRTTRVNTVVMKAVDVLDPAGTGMARPNELQFPTRATPVPCPSSPAYPSPLDLISSDNPQWYTRLIDLTARLGPKVAAFNRANPAAPITLLGKAEYMNPGMSHKDRIAKVMLQRAEDRNELFNSKGEKKTILAASSGNTGCSLALLGTLMGYDVIIITNKKCSAEKRAHIRANGATLWMSEDLVDVFPEDLAGVNCYMKQEDVLCAAYPDKYFSVNQYNNMDNSAAHYFGTGKEIWEQTKGGVTHFVMAGSTGGTIMGVGKYLKEKKPSCEVVLSDPHKSRLMGLWEQANDIDCQNGASNRLARVDAQIVTEGDVQIEGAGKSSLTKVMTEGGALPYVDSCVSVNDFDAFDECRAVAEEGVMVGGSAGLNICAARTVAERCAEEAPREGGVTITTLLCDHGIKYMSKIFNDEWMAANDVRPRLPADAQVPDPTPASPVISFVFSKEPPKTRRPDDAINFEA